jgi:hypothetical protein
MKTLQEQFNLIQEGKGHKDMFLKSARRLFPEYVTNFATYGEATTILKQRGILSEMKPQVVLLLNVHLILLKHLILM